MDTSSVLQSASIAQFYANKNVLITGATGEQCCMREGLLLLLHHHLCYRFHGQSAFGNSPQKM